MALKDATLRVPLKDHETKIEIGRGSRPVQINIDGITYFLTKEGAEVFSQKLHLAVQLLDEDRNDR